MKQRVKLSITKRIIFSVAALFLSIGILELLMIALEPYLFQGFFQYDPDIGFRVRPHARGSNRFGFNDIEYPLQKPPNTFRILVLSDSFNWIGGIENNYTALLEKKFEEHYGRHRVDVINADYRMTHTGEQLIILKKYGLQYNPDLVLLGFFAGNDFIDAHPNRKRVVVNDTYFDIDRHNELTIFNRLILPKSRLFYFIKQKYKIFRELAKAQLDTAEKPIPPQTKGEVHFLKRNFSQ